MPNPLKSNFCLTLVIVIGIEPIILVLGFLFKCASKIKEVGLLTIKVPPWTSTRVIAPVPALSNNLILKAPFSISALPLI